jgi:hypothetical protein
MRIKNRQSVLWVATSVLAATFLVSPVSAAAQGGGDFSLQVTPSPLTTVVKPGHETELELKIRNGGSQTENLKIEPRSFSFDSKNGKVTINDSKPPEIAGWIRFSAPTFAIQPDHWFSQKVHIAPPENAGFSYSFALLISRVSEAPEPASTSGILKGSVAVFTLINVDRPGATRKLEITKFSTGKGIYDALPTELNITIKNTGNTIAQPTGNIFIQRGSNDKTPISTLALNGKGSYILPGSTRILQTQWDSGFQVYKTIVNDDGSKSRQLTWNWANLSRLRIGRYTAKVIMVYNDGQRDVPIVGEVSFWVIPWKLLLIALVLVLLVTAGLWTWVRSGVRFFNKHKKLKMPRIGKRHDY